uniref:Putative secreted protein n=1 Tax=Anopheles darlingi TaxID=43151 RepID=A0A2M4DH33_ANODA
MGWRRLHRLRLLLLRPLHPRPAEARWLPMLPPAVLPLTGITTRSCCWQTTAFHSSIHDTFSPASTISRPHRCMHPASSSSSSNNIILMGRHSVICITHRTMVSPV